MRRNEQSRGITAVPTQKLSDRVWLAPGTEVRGLDWYPAESYRNDSAQWRWSGPNTNPRLRIPVVADTDARFDVHIAAFSAAEVRDSLTVLFNQNSVPFELHHESTGDSYVLRFVAPLSADHESVIEFPMTANSTAAMAESPLADRRQRGLCLLGIGIQPASAAPHPHWSEADLALRDFAFAGRDQAVAELATILRSRTWRYSAGIRALRRRVRRRLPRKTVG